MCTYDFNSTAAAAPAVRPRVGHIQHNNTPHSVTRAMYHSQTVELAYNNGFFWVDKHLCIETRARLRTYLTFRIIKLAKNAIYQGPPRHEAITVEVTTGNADRKGEQGEARPGDSAPRDRTWELLRTQLKTSFMRQILRLLSCNLDNMLRPYPIRDRCHHCPLKRPHDDCYDGVAPFFVSEVFQIFWELKASPKN